MTTKTLRTPSIFENNAGWFRFVNKALKFPYDEYQKIIVDFHAHSFLDTDKLVLLACLIESIKLINSEIEISFTGGDNRLNGHLETV
ncbi:hypothetical protein ED312_09895 [Sinomicrobium pectinilyticum]|uniref:STAS domain-containing protein n=1 Tax=Sinomicrobium pectinilyticum TaxID=1084421 RepID=A0A3N0EIR4_SINP1|nr:hypothetical protein ED312_09895 [Sinomicrobium pectinilyticum]